MFHKASRQRGSLEGVENGSISTGTNILIVCQHSYKLFETFPAIFIDSCRMSFMVFWTQVKEKIKILLKNLKI